VSAGFPLSAIVGQRSLVEALLVNAVSPQVGGVLVRGERGTAKSTAVRALAPLLPPVRAAIEEPFAFAPGQRAPRGEVAADAEVALRPAPLVELPLGATLDRLTGALDLRQALAGEPAFEPGILARAHQGILYVDEVNLLPDHLVDALLDAAASGVARVEREAVSVEHDAQFILVGTMNVEEGELRPQLLDRFGLGVEVSAPREAGERAEIVRRRLAFERDPVAFAARYAEPQRELAGRIAAARERLEVVRLPERELLRIAGACAELGVDGVRGDIVTARAARALAALDGAEEVEEGHVRRAAALALSHRRRRDPLDGGPSDPEAVERSLDDDPPEDDSPGGAPPPARASADDSGGAAGDGALASEGEPTPAGANPDAPAPPQRCDPPAPARLPSAALRLAGAGAGPFGRRARSGGPHAGAIDSRPARPDDAVAIAATLHARLLGAPAGHLRAPIPAGREGAFLCLVVDVSGSMGARRRLVRVKGALLELLRDAYARRDRVGLIAFRDSAAEIVIAPGTPIERAAEAIRALPAGGGTPLAAGLDAAERLVRAEAPREPRRRAIAVVLTDGRVRDPAGEVPRAAARLGRAAEAVHVIDTEDGPVLLGLAAAVAVAAGAQLHRLLDPDDSLPARSAA
jgi:magnesium chelatase subunit D